MPRLQLALLAALGAILVAGSARAQTPNEYMTRTIGYDNRGYGEPLVPEGVGLDRSSVGYETIRQAANTNAQVYGAIGAFERYLRPTFDALRFGKEESREKDRFVLAYDHHQTYGVGRAIGFCSSNANGVVAAPCDGQPRSYSADMYSVSVAVGKGTSSSGYFAAGSWSMTIVPPVGGESNETAMRGLFGFYTGLTAFAGLPFYRLLGKKVFNALMPGSADGILGGYTTVGPIRGYGGYVLSRGFFGDLAVPNYSPFLTTALAQDFASLALLRGGLRNLDVAKALGLPDTSGLTSLFAQRVVLPVPKVNPAETSLNELAKDMVQSPIITGHLRQLDLADYVDVNLAVGAVPKVFVNEAMISVHSKKFARRRLTPDRDDIRGDGPNASLGWSLSVGTASLPPLYYYAVEGGNRFAFKAQLQWGPLSAFVRMNDPEFLQAFPFAYNAVNAGITAGIAE